MKKRVLTPRPLVVENNDDGTVSYYITLTKGYKVQISREDIDLAEFLWFSQVKNLYATRMPEPNNHILMHRVILERMLGESIPKDMFPDHINGDRLDNRRSNLRLVTVQQSNQNKRSSRSRWGRGVTYRKQTNKYIATITIGSYDTPEEAAREWARIAILLRGDFVNLKCGDSIANKSNGQ